MATAYSFATQRPTRVHAVYFNGRPTGIEHLSQMAALVAAADYAKQMHQPESLMSVRSVALTAEEISR